AARRGTRRRFATPAVAVLPGGNIDRRVLLDVIERGMAAAARYRSRRLRVGGRPGALAELLGVVGELGANVLDVSHSRISGSLPLGDVEVALSMETRGPEHCAELVEALRAAGHAIVSGG